MEMRKVPTNNGIDPYVDSPAWPEPARAAPSNSGFHVSPVKNSQMGTNLKNLIDSNITEKIIGRTQL